MNIRRKADEEIGGVAAGVIQVLSQAPAVGIEMPINSAGLTDGEVRIILVQMA